jgi:hypothetical protein
MMRGVLRSLFVVAVMAGPALASVPTKKAAVASHHHKSRAKHTARASRHHKSHAKHKTPAKP